VGLALTAGLGFGVGALAKNFGYKKEPLWKFGVGAPVVVVVADYVYSEIYKPYIKFGPRYRDPEGWCQSNGAAGYASMQECIDTWKRNAEDQRRAGRSF
jgi:hypothetical protein